MSHEDLFIFRNNLDNFKKIILSEIRKLFKMQKVGAIIQVRMESTRLPGKALLKLKDKPCLQHVIERVAMSNKVDVIVIATTTRKADEAIVKFCYSAFPNNEVNGKKIKIVRGSIDDVYGRVLMAAQIHDIDIIVDITADCPLVDPYIIDDIVYYFIKDKLNYASNVIQRTWPDGYDVQVYSRELMEKADKVIMNKNDRTNAGYNIWRDCTALKSMLDIELRFGSSVAGIQYSFPKWRLTLDTKDDYKLLNKVFNNFEDNTFNYKDVIDFILKNHKLIKNKNLNE